MQGYTLVCCSDLTFAGGTSIFNYFPSGAIKMKFENTVLEGKLLVTTVY